MTLDGWTLGSALKRKKRKRINSGCIQITIQQNAQREWNKDLDDPSCVTTRVPHAEVFQTIVVLDRTESQKDFAWHLIVSNFDRSRLGS